MLYKKYTFQRIKLHSNKGYLTQLLNYLYIIYIIVRERCTHAKYVLYHRKSNK